MTIPKTSDEFLIQEYFKIKEELEKKEKIIETLKGELNTKVEDPKEEINMNMIFLSDSPSYYYYINVASYSYYNNILKDNKKKPSFLEECLKDEKKLNQWMKMEEKSSSWINDKVSEIDERIYNYLFKDRKDRYGVLILGVDENYYYNIDEKRVFLDKNKAEIVTKNRVIEEINKYLKSDYINSF